MCTPGCAGLCVQIMNMPSRMTSHTVGCGNTIFLTSSTRFLSAGPKEGMMRCLAHRSALRDKQKQGEEGNLSLAGSQYSERRWRPYVRPVAVL